MDKKIFPTFSLYDNCVILSLVAGHCSVACDGSVGCIGILYNWKCIVQRLHILVVQMNHVMQ